MIPISENTYKKHKPNMNLPVLSPTQVHKKMDVEGIIFDLQLTNLQNIYFPIHGYTKKDLLEYYDGVSEVIMPYLYDRPLIVERYPSGVHNKGFSQSEFVNPPEYSTSYKHFYNYFSGNSYLVTQNKPTLMYLINNGSVVLRPWYSRLTSVTKPDFSVISLKPYDTNSEKLIAVALGVKEILDSMEIKPLVKTSGEDGLHIYIPLGNLYSYQQSLNFAKLIALLTHKRMPGITSIDNYEGYRNNKIYIDYTRNTSSRPVVAPYSVRSTDDATVSTPLSWDEIDGDLNPKSFNIKSIPLRIKEKGDIWKKVYHREGINMIEILEQWAF